MGNPPALENVSEEYWTTLLDEWRGALTPELEAIFVDSALTMLDALPSVGVEWGGINQQAVAWARRYGWDLSEKIVSTTRETWQDAIGDFYAEHLTLEQLQERLKERLGRMFSPARVNMIAITETTRAAVEGERELVKELGQYGIKMVEVWQTERDELVCPICGGRHNKRKGDGWSDGDGPPAHPRCRCWINHELVKPE